MKWIRWIAILFIGLVFYTILAATFQLSHPIIEWTKQIPHGDKISHFLLVGGLAFCTNFFLKEREIEVIGNKVLLGSFTIFILMTFEEFTQIFIPHRNFDLLDLASNYLGILVIGTIGIRYFWGLQQLTSK